MVAENASVRRMAIGHKETVASDDRLFAICRSEMNGGELANNSPIANFDIAYRPLLILEILCLHADKRVRKYLALLSNSGMAIYNRALTD